MKPVLAFQTKGKMTESESKKIKLSDREKSQPILFTWKIKYY